MLDEYLALGGVELGNNARAKAYASCLSCCAGLLKGEVCTALHDATNAFANAVWEWQAEQVNLLSNPSYEVGSGSVTVRTNRSINPHFALPAGEGQTVAGWTGVVRQGNAAVNLGATNVYSDNMTAAPGEAVSGALTLLAPSSTPTVTVSLRETKAGLFGTQPTVESKVVTLARGVPTRIELGGMITGADSDGFRFNFTATAPSVAQFVQSIAERNFSTTPGLFFSGTTRPKERRNFATAPTGTTSAGWNPNTTLYARTYDAAGGRRPGAGAVKLTRSADAPSVSLASAYNAGTSSWTPEGRVAVLPGETWTISAWAKADKAFTEALDVRFYDAANAQVGQANSPDALGAAGEWARAAVTVTVPANATQVGIIAHTVNLQSGVTVGGEQVWMTDALFERTDALRDYFDGSSEVAAGFATAWDGAVGASSSYVYDTDVSVAWAGTANGSESILSGVKAPGITTSVGVAAIVSTRWVKSGTHSLRLIPTSATNNVSYVTMDVPVDARDSGTAMVTVHQEAALTGSLWAYRGRPYVTAPQTPSPDQLPNAAGDLEHRWSYSGLGVTHVLLLPHGGQSLSGDVWYDAAAILAGVYDGPWFDGSNLPANYDPALWRTSWLGAEDASVSLLEEYVLVTPSASAEPPYSCSEIARAPWYDQSNPFSQDFAGFYLLSVKGITDGTMTAGVTESVGYGGVIGAPHYATRSVRVRSMLIGCGRAATHYGLAWLKAALGESFCSRHGNACGTSDLEFFIDCPPALDPGETDYASATATYRRYLHDVACTSAPIIAEEYETTSGAYVVVVEYILTAESPFVWGQTFQAESTGAVLTAYDDIPFNLMRRPSGEEGDGVPAVVATQYAFNGSAEYGGSSTTLPTGWARSQTNITAGLSDAKSSDIAAVGPNSARVRLLATGAVTDGTIRLYYDVPLGSLPAGSAPSVSMWAAALVFAGSPTLEPITAEVEWRTSTASLGYVGLGTIPVNGGNISAPGLSKPASATVARLHVVLPVDSAIAGDDIRLYADAFGLTVP